MSWTGGESLLDNRAIPKKIEVKKTLKRTKNSTNNSATCTNIEGRSRPNRSGDVIMFPNIEMCSKDLFPKPQKVGNAMKKRNTNILAKDQKVG